MSLSDRAHNLSFSCCLLQSYRQRTYHEGKHRLPSVLTRTSVRTEQLAESTKTAPSSVQSLISLTIKTRTSASNLPLTEQPLPHYCLQPIPSSHPVLAERI